MLNDPLGPDPIVVTGSANFSAASTNANQENMLVIRGDKRAADIYLGEFMRVFSHYSFREAVANFNERVKKARAAGRALPEWKPQFLIPNDSWQKDYFTAGDQRFLRREYFAG
jgi:phosphatidylserine/phosphatidylglycerophosphate/cardiolipin synthase-like enzyme